MKVRGTEKKTVEVEIDTNDALNALEEHFFKSIGVNREAFPKNNSWYISVDVGHHTSDYEDVFLSEAKAKDVKTYEAFQVLRKHLK